MKDYNFTAFNPVDITKVGHFTQMIWKSTKQMGVGAARTADNKTLIIVVNYAPAGNIRNYYQSNVYPWLNK